MLLALVAILTAMVVGAEPTPASAAVHAVAGTVTLTDARGETFEAPGVELVLACAATPGEPQTAASDEHGVFRFADVRVGRCALSADLQGFGTVTADIVVGASTALPLEIHLDVAPVDSGVRVVAESSCSWPTKRFN